MQNRKGKLVDTLIVYFDKEKTCRQVIRPQMSGPNKFDGNWKALAASIANGHSYTFDVE
jgi:hypothetical protein